MAILEGDHIYPCTVVYDRYGGTYSGAAYTAWNLEFDEVPPEIHWDDVTVHKFFLYASEKPIYGLGATAQEAIDDLIYKYKNNIKNKDIS